MFRSKGRLLDLVQAVFDFIRPDNGWFIEFFASRVCKIIFFSFGKRGHLNFDDRYDNLALPFKFETSEFEEMRVDWLLNWNSTEQKISGYFLDWN